MRIKEITQAKGTEVHAIGPEAKLDDVVRELVSYNIGSLVVCEPDMERTVPLVLGIITERDILLAQVAHQAPLDRPRVTTIMATELVTALPDDRIETAMRLMTYRRVRHLPVLLQCELIGIVSIGDILKTHYDQLVVENHFLKCHIHG